MRSRVAIVTNRFRLTLLAMLAVVAAACVAPSDDHPAEGRVSIPLTSTGDDGMIYRLANATFELTGPGGTQVVNGNADVPSVTVELPPGLTSVLLRPGWMLSRSNDGGGSFTPVSALLGSANPLTLRVLADTSTNLSFEFLVRNPNGMLTVRFGVTATPRQLAGGMTITAGTGDLVAYAGKRLDFSIYFSLGQLSRNVEVDGSKTLVYDAGAVATEFFNDAIGTLTGVVAPAMAGGFLEYQITAKADGTQEFRGTYSGGGDPFPTIDFGPQLLTFPLPLDANGFPVDQFFIDVIPFHLAYSTISGDSTATGRFTLRHLLR
jgi:hypothetical protein